MAAAPDGRVITGSSDKTVKVWRDGACERTIQAHTDGVNAVAVLPGGARFVSGSHDGTAKLWTLDGALERTFEVGNDGALRRGAARRRALCGRPWTTTNEGDVRLYHVDGTLVHTFKGHTERVNAVAVTPDGQHIISGSSDKLVKVWSVASKSLVSTCAGHTDYRFGGGGDARRPAHPQRRSNDNTVRVWLLDGTLENTFELHTDR